MMAVAILWYSLTPTMYIVKSFICVKFNNNLKLHCIQPNISVEYSSPLPGIQIAYDVFLWQFM